MSKPIFTARELRDYPPITKAIATLSDPSPFGNRGILSEYSMALQKSLGIVPRGVFVPWESMIKALNVTAFSGGGAFVETEIGDVWDILRPRSVCLSLGAQMLDGLEKPTALPRQTGTQSLVWGSEVSAANLFDATLGQSVLKPHRGTTATSYSREFLMQGGPRADAFVSRDLLKAVGTGIDFAALAGDGNAAPVGILNLENVGQVSFGGAATWAKVCSIERKVADANADYSGTLAFVSSPAVREKWEQILRGTSTTNFLWQDGKIGEYQAIATNNLEDSNSVIFGNWEKLVISMFRAVDLIVNPFSLDTQNKIRVVAIVYVDVAVPFPGAFAVSTDAGNQ